MASTPITIQDIYNFINQVAAQATGRTGLTAVDTRSFVNVGQVLLDTFNENTANAISTVIGRTIFSVRPWTGRFRSIYTDPMRWGYVTRKITPLRHSFEASQDWNTNLSPAQLADGNSIDMYKIKAPKFIQTNFWGIKTLQDHITRFYKQYAVAFRSEGEMMQFITSFMTEFYNVIMEKNDAEVEGTLLNYMGGIYDMGLTVVDLRKEYNKRYASNYTRDELLSTYLDSFMKFMAASIKTWSKRITDRNTLYHANITGYEKIDRHTPKNRQKMLMYSPLFIEAESMVYSSLFNPSYLNVGSFEDVNYWQDPSNPTAIDVIPNLLDVTTGLASAGNEVKLPFVLGLLYDEEGLGITPQFERSSTTPYNSAGEYYNIYYHWTMAPYNDFTENAVLFIIGDESDNAQAVSVLVEGNPVADTNTIELVATTGETEPVPVAEETKTSKTTKKKE